MREKMISVIDHIRKNKDISFDELKLLIDEEDETAISYLKESARSVADDIYGRDIFIRGLIEFTNYCRNDCYYCGIRCSNKQAERYRLTRQDIYDCANRGYELGFRTFVLQGGEDVFYTDDMICEIVSAIKNMHPDCAVTLSIGEKPRESYKAYYDAGCDRYLLRHETAGRAHYERLHPAGMSYDNRRRCLYDLKDIGYQVGCGFMTGSPYQTIDDIYEDLRFIKELEPHMVGIGPFIRHKDTPFADKRSGDLELTLRLLAIIRLIHPHVLLPATTALGTLHPLGRELGIRAGANVVMPNLSPVNVRAKYMLYDNKICTGDEAAECRLCMQRRMEAIGFKVVTDRGDYRF